jgi:hypothetical protein
MTNPPPILPKVVTEKSPDFKEIFADGVYTWANTGAGTLIFFKDTFDPTITQEGQLNVKSIHRVFTVEVRMPRELYKNLIEWMSGQLKNVEDLEKSQNINQK